MATISSLTAAALTGTTQTILQTVKGTTRRLPAERRIGR